MFPSVHLDARRLRTNTVKRCVVEGECVDAGTTCMEGTCRPYVYETKGTDRTTCLTECESDVRLDEAFYYNGEPEIVQRMSNDRGCVVAYRRTTRQEKTVPVERWQKERLGVVVRTDPYGSLWTAWCPWTDPVRCGVDAECDGTEMCVNRTCVSYMTPTSDGEGCVTPCFEEIELYESHYYNRNVTKVEGYGSIKGGCTVVYEVVGGTEGVSKEDYEKQTRGNMMRTEQKGGRGVAWCTKPTHKQTKKRVVQDVGAKREDRGTGLPPKCKTLYVDLGSNNGVQIRKLFEPSKYKEAIVLPHYDQRLGDVADRRKHTCAFGFEANPKHTKRLNLIAQKYNKRGWKTRFFHNVVWVADNETMVIYTDDSNANNDWGAGILPDAIPNKNKMTSFEVPTIDIARWFKETIKTYRPSTVMVKMDIEGSEYHVLPHLIRQGLLCSDKIACIALEFHKWAKHEHTLTLPLFHKELAKQDCTPTQILNIDDETYLHDGQTLPTIEGRTIDSKCITLVHIPKTGGTSLNKYLKNSGRCHTSLQACYDDLRHQRPDNYHVVVVREPQAHVKSQFLMCRDSKWGKGVRTSDFPISHNETADYERWLRHFISLRTDQVGPMYDYNCGDPRNTQTRHLGCSGFKPGKVHPANHALTQSLNLDKALFNLRRASLVGVTSRLKETTCIMKEEMHLDDGVDLQHINHGVRNSNERLNVFEDLVSKLTREDQQVYIQGKTLFENKVRKTKCWDQNK